MTAIVEFEVLGIPRPQGSKKAFSVGGHARMKESGGLEHAAWRNAVAQAAKDVAGDVGKLTGPLQLDVTYRFPMPKSRPKTTRAHGQGWHTVAPDRDKLDRAICDGLQAGGLIANDAQVCLGSSMKVEIADGWTGAQITLIPLMELP